MNKTFTMSILVVAAVMITVSLILDSTVYAHKVIVKAVEIRNTSCISESQPIIKTKTEIKTIVQNYHMYSEEESPSPHETSQFISIDRERQKVLLPISNAHIGYLYATGSMLPAMNGKTKIIYVDPTLSNIKVGDIIYFHSGAEYQNNMIYHRVISIPSIGIYQTKGDNNPSADYEFVEFSKVEGVVAAIVY